MGAPKTAPLRDQVISEITVAPGWNKADATALVDALIAEVRDAGVTVAAQPADLGQQTVYSTPLGKRVASVRESAAKHGIPIKDNGLPVDVVRPAPFDDDLAQPAPDALRAAAQAGTIAILEEVRLFAEMLWTVNQSKDRAIERIVGEIDRRIAALEPQP